MNIIKVNNVSFSYNGHLLLKNINLKISTGEFTAIIGPNGAGKTTFLKLLCGLIKPLDGEIKLFNLSVEEAIEAGIVAYVPQNYIDNIKGFPLIAREIVELGAWRLDFNKRKHIVQHMLEMTGLIEYMNLRVDELSGGLQQRLMVAKALAGNPRLLLLDEPISGVDIDARLKIFKLLIQLKEVMHINILMVSHDMENIFKFTKKIIYLNKNIFFYNTYDEIKNNLKIIL